MAIIFFAEGLSAKCKKLVDDEIIQLFLSPEVLAEMWEVMLRPEFLAKFEAFTEVMIKSYLEELAKKSIVLNAVPKLFKFPGDPDDEDYINLAVEAEADFIVTRDKDLLDLMTGYDDTSKDLGIFSFSAFFCNRSYNFAVAFSFFPPSNYSVK